MFVPNTRGYWQKKASKRSITGKETFSAPVRLPLSIVSLNDSVAPTSVRADTSASRGAAEQSEAAATFLVPPAFKVSRGDIVTILDTVVEVTGSEVRLDTFGKLDHYQVTGRLRQDL